MFKDNTLLLWTIVVFATIETGDNKDLFTDYGTENTVTYNVHVEMY